MHSNHHFKLFLYDMTIQRSTSSSLFVSSQLNLAILNTILLWQVMLLAALSLYFLP